jgi:hypothetical protein
LREAPSTPFRSTTRQVPWRRQSVVSIVNT